MHPFSTPDATRTEDALRARIEALEAELQSANARYDAQRANLGLLAHALLTPMNAIVGYTRIANRRGKAAFDALGTPGRVEQLLREQTQYLDSAQSAQDDLLRLINQIVDLSKADLSQLDVYLESERIEELFGSVCRSVEPLVARASARLEVTLPEVPATVNTDVAKLRRILIHLLSRAAGCSPNGRVGLSVEIVGGQLGIRVTDTGMGMSPETLARVFEPFSEPDPAAESRVRDASLAIVRHLAQLLGGSVSAQSRENHGSTFTLVVPLVHPQVAREQAGGAA